MKKKKYKKPKMEVKKLESYFFACLKSTKDGCVSYLTNRILGSGCPQ